MRWLSRPLVVAAALALVAVAAFGGEDRLSEDLPVLRHLEILGNDHVSDGRIRDAMILKSPSLSRPLKRSRFRREFLDADVRSITRYYRSLGYLQAAVAVDVGYDEDYRKASVTLRVHEGERTLVSSVSVDGNRAVPAIRLLNEAKTRAGGPYNEFQVRVDREAVLAFLNDLGYLAAAVSDSVKIADLRAEVVFIVSEGEPTRLRSVAVTGNEKTATSYVLRELVVRPGDLVRRRKIVESQKMLFETGLFRDVRMHSMLPDSVPGAVDLAVDVRERRTAWYGFGVGYSSRDLARLSAEWGHRNIGGAGRRLTLETRFGLSLDTLFVKGTFPPLGESVTELSWTEPWFLGTRTPLQTSAYHRFQTQKTFEQTILGLKTTARRNLSTTARLFLTLENRWVFTTDSTQVRERYQSRLMDVRSERDTRDNVFDPVSGTLQQGLLEYAGGFLGGQSTFAKASISSAWYERLVPGLVVAWRLQMGLIEPIRSQLGAAEGGLAVLDVPFEDRFRLGGASTIRGYEEQQLGRTLVVDDKAQPLGGLAMYLANVEVRFHLFWLFSGALFADSGTVWSDRREVKPERFIGELNGGPPSVLDVKYGVGGGLRFLTPVGPVRVDYGRKIGSSRTLAARPYEWHLSVGQAF